MFRYRRNFIWALLLCSHLAACAAAPPNTPTVLTGRWHVVTDKDTLASIAARYGTDPAVIQELNDLQDDRALATRKAVFIPLATGKPPGAAPAPAGAVESTRTASSSKPERNAGTASVSSKKAPLPSCESAGNPCLEWPLLGSLGPRFDSVGSKPHDGLDILAVEGALIRAADAGEVLYSGAEIKGYGNLIILRHTNNMLTVYAHNDKNLVSEGARVDRGAIIAEAGRSGNAAKVHLHFEVRVSETPKDPLEYLPPR